MGYIPTNWKDHVLSDNRYVIKQNSDGTVSITPAGKVVQQGTSMSAENFNHMEEGIKAAAETLDDLKCSVAINRSSIGLQKKNLLKPVSGSQINKTEQGVTGHLNDDGSVSFSGVLTAVAWFGLSSYHNTLPPGKYILTGCLSGGGNTTHSTYVRNRANNATLATDYGTGAAFTLTQTTNIDFVIKLTEKREYGENDIFYPMIRSAEIADDSYEQYKSALQEQIDVLSESATKVSHGYSTSNTNYQLLLGTASTSTVNESPVKNSNFTANPSTGVLTAKYFHTLASGTLLADSTTDENSLTVTNAEIAKYSQVYMAASWTEKETVNFCDVIPISAIVAGAVFTKQIYTGTRIYTYTVTCTSAGVFTLTQSNSTGAAGTLRLKLYVI